MRRLFACLLVAIAALVALPALAKPAPLRVLYLDQWVGWKHAPVARPEAGGLAPSETAMIAIGEESGAFTAQVTQDAREITPQSLDNVDVLVFYTTGTIPVSPEAWAAIQQRVAAGKLGFVGLHSAADTAWSYEGPGDTYTRFLNGHFAAHPWVEGTPVRIETLDPDAPMMSMWSLGFDYAEEIYQYTDFDPTRVRVLQTLDFSDMRLRRPYAVPVAWARQIGKGRMFYTNLGHTVATWSDPRFRHQIVEAVNWTAGRTRGDATPDPFRQFLWQVKALLAYQPVAGRDDTAILDRVARMDPAWQAAIAARIAGLQSLYPEKPDADRAPFDTAYRAVLGEVLAQGGSR